jgi:hypothetical protein
MGYPRQVNWPMTSWKSDSSNMAGTNAATPQDSAATPPNQSSLHSSSMTWPSNTRIHSISTSSSTHSVSLMKESPSIGKPTILWHHHEMVLPSSHMQTFHAGVHCCNPQEIQPQRSCAPTSLPPSFQCPPQYGTKVQLTYPINTSPSLNSIAIQQIQQVVGTLLYYDGRAVDNTLLVALSALASKQSTATKRTNHSIT